MITLHLSPLARKSISISIHIGVGACKEFPSLVQAAAPDKICILHDAGVAAVANDVAKKLNTAVLVSVPSGEASKSLEWVEHIVGKLLEVGMTRNSLLIIVGGGMMTDLGGFVASVYMRGIRFIQVPTSMLCMVDAGLGGKTGVDVGNVKNIVGTTAHPEAIVIDPDVLVTLPDSHIREGLVEVIKMAACLSEESFVWLEENIDAIVQRDMTAIEDCIERAVRMKIDVVTSDEHETGRRKLLNFGHTVGHALEAHSRFALSHGRAVSRGMIAEMTAAASSVTERVAALLKRIDMPTELPSSEDAAVLWKIMQNDKKVTDGKVMMAVPTDIGTADLQILSEESWQKLTA